MLKMLVAVMFIGLGTAACAQCGGHAALVGCLGNHHSCLRCTCDSCYHTFRYTATLLPPQEPSPGTELVLDLHFPTQEYRGRVVDYDDQGLNCCGGWTSYWVSDFRKKTEITWFLQAVQCGSLREYAKKDTKGNTYWQFRGLAVATPIQVTLTAPQTRPDRRGSMPYEQLDITYDFYWEQPLKKVRNK